MFLFGFFFVFVGCLMYVFLWSHGKGIEESDHILSFERCHRPDMVWYDVANTQ